jgi:hypothetical protein
LIWYLIIKVDKYILFSAEHSKELSEFLNIYRYIYKKYIIAEKNDSFSAFLVFAIAIVFIIGSSVADRLIVFREIGEGDFSIAIAITIPIPIQEEKGILSQAIHPIPFVDPKKG